MCVAGWAFMHRHDDDEARSMCTYTRFPVRMYDRMFDNGHMVNGKRCDRNLTFYSSGYSYLLWMSIRTFSSEKGVIVWVSWTFSSLRSCDSSPIPRNASLMCLHRDLREGKIVHSRLLILWSFGVIVEPRPIYVSSWY